MRYIKKYNEKFDVININLKNEIKEYLLTNYPSQWWSHNSDFDYIKKDIKKKFLLSEDEFHKNKIDDIIKKHKKIMKND